MTPTTQILRGRVLRLLTEPVLWLLVAIIIIGALTSPHFLTSQNVANLLRNASVVGLMAVGFSVVLLTGRIDLSVAAIMVFSMIAGVLISAEIGKGLGLRWMVRGNTFAGPQLLAIVITLAVGFCLGLVNGFGSVGLKVASFIFTLVTMSAMRGLSYLVTNGAPIYYSDGLFRWLGEASYGFLPVSFVIFATITLALYWLLNRTVLGRRLYAVGGNEKATVYAGISSNHIIVLAFSISGFCSAVAGVLFTSRLMSVEPALGQGYELMAITVAVIGGVSLLGGRGSILMVLVAAVTFSAGLNLLALWGVATWYQNLAVGVALIFTLVLGRWKSRD